MSRHLRNTMAIAHAGIAGPSSRPFVRSTLLPVAASQRRHVSTDWMTSWWDAAKERRRQRSDKKEEASGSSAQEPPAENRGIFEDVEVARPESKKKKHDQHTQESELFEISHRKLNLLSRQIAGLPIDEAILQMQFSPKAAARWLRPLLIKARDKAVMEKGMQQDKLVISRAWINKAPSGPTRPDFKGRGRMGIIKQRNSRILFTLVEGKTPSEIQDIKFIKRADKLARSAGVVREDMKLRRKVISDWAW